METEAQESKSLSEQTLIASFSEITSSSIEDARFFLESHNWELDAAVSTFLDDAPGAAAAAVAAASDHDQPMNPPASRSPSPEFVPSRSRSPDPEPESEPSRRRPYDLRSGRAADKKPSGSRTRGVRTLSDLNRAEGDSGSDSDEPPQYYTGGEKSGMLVQDPTKGYDVDAFFNQAKKSGGVVENPAQASSSSRSFTGTGRLLTGDTVEATPQPPNAINHTIVFWRNGFTVNDGPLRLLDDPQNARFLESIKRSEYPAELAPAVRETPVTVSLTKRNEDYIEPVRPRSSFQGVGRTLGGGSSGPTATSALTETQSSVTLRTPVPAMGLIVDDSFPSTSLQLRLADGTRMVSRFNHHHTIRDVRSFIDSSRPGGPRNYLLQIMGFPPKQLNDLDQTIEQAGIANSVIIQKL